LEGKEK
jgi:hypothetical protein